MNYRSANFSLLRSKESSHRRRSTLFTQNMESHCCGCSNLCIGVLQLRNQQRDGLFDTELTQRSDDDNADLGVSVIQFRQQRRDSPFITQSHQCFNYGLADIGHRRCATSERKAGFRNRRARE